MLALHFLLQDHGQFVGADWGAEVYQSESRKDRITDDAQLPPGKCLWNTKLPQQIVDANNTIYCMIIDFYD